MTCQYFPLKIFYSKKRDGSKLRGTPEVVAAVREKKKVKILEACGRKRKVEQN